MARKSNWAIPSRFRGCRTPQEEKHWRMIRMEAIEARINWETDSIQPWQIPASASHNPCDSSADGHLSFEEEQ